MNDRAFLIWIHERLHGVHGESEHADFMHKLRAIIMTYPKDKLTPNTAVTNSIEEVKKYLAIKDAEEP